MSRGIFYENQTGLVHTKMLISYGMPLVVALKALLLTQVLNIYTDREVHEKTTWAIIMLVSLHIFKNKLVGWWNGSSSKCACLASVRH
jgi:hypothetical protein